MSQISPTLFRAYDIRGVVDRELTEDAARLIGRAFGSEALQRGQAAVAVGRDGRLSGPRLIGALTEGLLASGIDVIDVGCVPTPVVYFAAEELGTRTCIAVTGSHNPPEYNGLKLVIDGETLYGDTIQGLRERIEHDDFASGQGTRREEDIAERYLDRITGDIKLARPLRLAVDCGNGVAGELAPQLLERLGCTVEKLYCEIDGLFPNHHPNPSEPENLEDLIAKVRADGLDLGLAFDGDGDRLGVIDAAGCVIWADRQMMLYAADVLSRNPGATILYDVKCSRHLGEAIARHGGQPLMWKTGHSLVKAKMRETGAQLGGEMSGHIFFKERWYGFDDALYTAARLLEILGKDSRTPTEVFAELPDSINTPELNVHFAEEGAHFEFMRKLAEHADFGNAELTTIDGLRADYAHGWGLVRPSNTTPSLVIRFEADDPAALDQIQGIFRAQMLAVEPSLELPF
ncbi:phosphomannomutase/phosphoglucomutase [Acidihalobacter ferrooxydans]|uniref:phosphomannomutase n=1 Tax=Acidihalobacter ferrooxydans TaxID=1765967 RepID=A0A1P8UJC8_9GAMM|nr:phosphomannomutase/phosphoglucomutase [Acidihalobacter ferrooxydans]APZ43881.1 phosphomannomutase/phosphoglucomutase [Acidihalobacter ferrooxydans]